MIASYDEEHNKEVKKRFDDQKIVFKGAIAASSENGTPGEMYFVYHGKDEKDPHQFVMSDQYFINGLIKNWEIKELDLIHAERDDELMVSSKYR